MLSLDPLFENVRLRPLLPMIYVAWADGTLSGDELESIREAAHPWLTPSCEEHLAAWLNAAAPPSATSLQALLARLRESSAGLGEDARGDLVEVGMQLARSGAGSDDLSWLTDDVARALEQVRDALGFVGPAAARDFAPVQKIAVEVPEPPFDLEAMGAILDGPYAEFKRKTRDELASLGWQYEVDVPKETLRATTTDRVRKLAELGYGKRAFPGVTSDGDLGHFVATFESLGYFDLSLVVKYGVQFGLWGGSIYFLGTEKHHEKYLPKVAAMELPGCFAMSELGHGSNVRDVETSVTYDADADELVVHSPTESSRKEWIGNAARDGQMATVFAQLKVGELDHGVHAFIVPLRDNSGALAPGVRIADCGHKLGLNGVDNGRIWFDQVRIPRENMLDKYAWINDNGGYESPITSPGRRFFTMLGTLVGGRVAVGSAGIAAAKSALTIATRYATQRRQFGPGEGAQEVSIMQYRTHQLRLLPRIAKAYALSLAFHALIEDFKSRDTEDSQEFEAHVAGLKSYATWFANDTIQECREACGGQGYLTANRFAALRADADIFATFEGDNTVLMQLVAKACLSKFQSQFSEPGLFGVVRFIARQASSVVAETNPVTTRLTATEHLRSAELHGDALRYRDAYLTQTLARRFKSRLDDGMDPFDALNDSQDHFMSLAHAHIERIVYEAFADAVEATPAGAEREMLESLRALYGLSCLQDDMGWFMEAGVIAAVKSRAIRAEINALCGELTPHARALVDAFGIPDQLLSAPIGLGHAGA